MHPRQIPPDLIASIRSERTREVAHMINLGMTNKQLAARLDISIHTVKSHLRRIQDLRNIRQRKHPLPSLDTPGLTPRESEVIRYSSTLLDADVAALLEISIESVYSHLRNARRKVGENGI